MPTDKTENVLAKLIRQGYLVKSVENKVLGEDETITWHVGPRGKKEVGNEAVAAFVREVYGGSSDDLEKKLQASLRVRERKPPPANNRGGEENGDEGGGDDAGDGGRRRSRRRAEDESEEGD
jgi:hypothetical protein